MPDTVLTTVQAVPAGGFTPPAAGGGRGGLPAAYSDLGSFCRAVATVKPAADSSITVEIWMPERGWNRKLLALGGQGWAGTIGYGGMRDALRRGYAVAATDSGHKGATATFALEHPEGVIDFAFRSAHEMARKAKAMVEAFYGKPAGHAYWDGCSTGGRMALTEAQRFPDDFDGIIAGAPANFSSHQAAQMIAVALAAHRDESSLIPPAKLRLMHEAVLRACDAADGVNDGVIEDPSRCRFDPKGLECAQADADDCLTRSQVAAARAIYAPVINPRTGAMIFPGFAPGSELGWTLLAGPRPLEFPQEFYRYFVFRDPDWDYRTLDLDIDVRRAEQAYGGIMDAVDPDLKAFFKRGGKLLQYHGWSDQAVAPSNSIDYFKRVAAASGGERTVRASYRLFMVPGMGHCTGGDGTSTFDALAALERWVEDGRPPDSIPASRVVGGIVVRTRPLCPYPEVAVYKGKGSTDVAENFVCKVV